jgi:hypothetical protein
MSPIPASPEFENVYFGYDCFAREVRFPKPITIFEGKTWNSYIFT